MDLDTATKRIRAAADARRDPNFLIMARTDIRAVDGLEAAQDRAKALVEAGADAIFPEAMKDLERVPGHPRRRGRADPGQHDRVRQERAVHGGRAAGVGVNMVIYPVTLLRSAMGAAERTLESIKADGTQEAQVGSMLTRARLYDLVDYEAYNRFDTGVFNFQIPGRPALTPAPAGQQARNEGVQHG